jgi:hypothetical protein
MGAILHAGIPTYLISIKLPRSRPAAAADFLVVPKSTWYVKTLRSESFNFA